MSWSVEDIMSSEREKIMEEEVIMSLVEAIGMQYIIPLVGSVLEIKKTSRLTGIKQTKRMCIGINLGLSQKKR